MCTPQGVFDICVCKAFDEAVKACKCIRQYRTNLGKLQTEMTSLECRMAIIERNVGEANDRGEEVENDVSDWQTKAGTLKSDVDQLVQHITDNENMHCFTRSSPNIKCRYQMSKQAEQKIPDVQQLIRDSHFDRISHPRPPHAELEFPSNKNYVDFDSRAPIFKKIVDALKDPNVKMVGLYGLGGVGKTILVKEVSQKMRSDGNFKKVSLLVVSKNLYVKEIQSKLADSLDLKLDAMADEKGRAIELWNKLTNGDNYLVILDDIWDKVDLTAIGIPIKDENKRCKVLLTSRNKDLLQKKMRVDKNFQIGVLPFPEAWTLFKKMAGNFIESQREINSLAEQVCEKCKGLPIAINALGAALKGQPEYEWRNALKNLNRYMLTNFEGIDSSVWALLRMNYNMLKSSDAKSCFLLCCLFAEDAEISIDDLTRHCVARRLLCQKPRTFDEATSAVSTIISTLKSASLLLNDSNENVVKIDNVIRDVGISIGREDKAFLVDHAALQWPENPIDGPSYEAISLRSGKIKKLSDGLMCPQLHTLIFHNDELSDLEVPDKFFSGMKKLTVLILTRLRMRQLPSSLANLTNLRMLYLNECELEDIAILGNLKNNLEVLSLQGSNITVLPQEIGQLTSLRLLDLRDCDKLQVIPQGVISHLTNLEELFFPHEVDKWEPSTGKQEDTSSSSNGSLDELRLLLSTGQLTTLHICIPGVMLLSDKGLMFERLKRFKIAVGARKFYYDLKKYSIALELNGITFRNELIPLVEKAKVLSLYKIEALEKALHDSRVGYENFGLHPSWSLNNLTVLTIFDCKIKYLFSESTARGLIHLKRLDVRWCLIMKEIVRFEGQNDEDKLRSEVIKFSKLKKLQLYDLPDLISFSAEKENMKTTMESSSTHAQPLFNEKVAFPALEELYIFNVPNITETWDKQPLPKQEKEIESFRKLDYVSVYRCEQLVYVFPSNMLPRLQNLRSLEITNCKEMEVIVSWEPKEKEVAKDDIIVFPRLEYMHLKGLDKLKSFCFGTQLFFSDQVAFPALEELYIFNAPNITEIWDKQPLPKQEKEIESFCKLNYVSVYHCEQLVYVFPSYMLPRLQNLRSLEITNCKEVEVIVSWEPKEKEVAKNDIIVFPQLEYVQLKGLDKLKSFCFGTQLFFSDKDAFPILTTIHLDENSTKKVAIEECGRRPSKKKGMWHKWQKK